jgi:preprotein translocase subunit SecG
MQTVLIVIHLMVVLALTGLVLLQKSEGGGLGMGGGGGFMTSRGTANVLTRSTAILAGIFFVTSLLLSLLANVERRPSSILGTGTPSQNAPLTPLGQGKGVLDQLNQTAPPAAPAPPSGPQVPQSR